jgi:hypothetical protein
MTRQSRWRRAALATVAVLGLLGGAASLASLGNHPNHSEKTLTADALLIAHRACAAGVPRGCSYVSDYEHDDEVVVRSDKPHGLKSDKAGFMSFNACRANVRGGCALEMAIVDPKRKFTRAYIERIGIYDHEVNGTKVPPSDEAFKW